LLFKINPTSNVGDSSWQPEKGKAAAEFIESRFSFGRTEQGVLFLEIIRSSRLFFFSPRLGISLCPRRRFSTSVEPSRIRFNVFGGVEVVVTWSLTN
jgi:hypothetical protein